MVSGCVSSGLVVTASLRVAGGSGPRPHGANETSEVVSNLVTVLTSETYETSSLNQPIHLEWGKVPVLSDLVGRTGGAPWPDRVEPSAEVILLLVGGGPGNCLAIARFGISAGGARRNPVPPRRVMRICGLTASLGL